MALSERRGRLGEASAVMPYSTSDASSFVCAGDRDIDGDSAAHGDSSVTSLSLECVVLESTVEIDAARSPLLEDPADWLSVLLCFIRFGGRWKTSTSLGVVGTFSTPKSLVEPAVSFAVAAFDDEGTGAVLRGSTRRERAASAAGNV